MKAFKALLLINSILIFSGCTGGFSARTVMSRITNPSTDDQVIDPDPKLPEDPGATPVVSPQPEPTPVVTGEPPPVVVESQKIISDPQVAVNKVQEVRAELQADPQYAFVAEDFSLLEEEGLIDADSDLKGWVK